MAQILRLYWVHGEAALCYAVPNAFECLLALHKAEAGTAVAAALCCMWHTMTGCHALLGAHYFQLEKAGCITLCVAYAVLNASKLLSKRVFIQSTSI